MTWIDEPTGSDEDLGRGAERMLERLLWPTSADDLPPDDGVVAFG